MFFIKRSQDKKSYKLDEALAHNCHARPKTRREFISQGFQLGAAGVIGSSALGMLAPNRAAADCVVGSSGAGKIPFIAFDLAGGANIAGSNVLVGQRGGQLDFLSATGYDRLGLPLSLVPEAVDSDNVDQTLGLAFHSDSAMLKGILERTNAVTQSQVNGAVIAARSENDTGNNTHNPMYAIARAGANGGVLGLIGSRTSVSGANSMSPSWLIDPTKQPTKIDRPSDATGLVDLGKLIDLPSRPGLLGQQEAVSVMNAISRISNLKLQGINSHNVAQLRTEIDELVNCGYLQSADLASRFGNPSDLDPAQDADIVGDTGIFSTSEFIGDREFQKTASVMKLVIEGNAGAGTITMGGYDYHTGDRSTGELRDLRAGRCIGACLEYARLKNQPLMIYVYSDGGVFSNGRIDNMQATRIAASGEADVLGTEEKGEWTGDSQATAASFMLVYDPNSGGRLEVRRNQLGHMRPDAAVETSLTISRNIGANSPDSLVDIVALNYMALHGQTGMFGNSDMFGGRIPTDLIDQHLIFDRLGSVDASTGRIIGS